MQAYIRKLHNDRYYIIEGAPENHKQNTNILGDFNTRRQAIRHANKNGYDLIIRNGTSVSEQPDHEPRKEVMINMAEQDFYRVTNYGDSIKPASGMKIERSIYFQSTNADISQHTAMPLEQLQTMREESAAAEQAIFDKLRGATTEWEEQAAQTLILEKAIEYVKTPAVAHSSNRWVKDPVNNDFRSMSNMVYKMTSHVSVNAPRPPLVPSWDLTWSVRTNTPDTRLSSKIAGQDRKHFTDIDTMEKYLNGRIKAYSHLFTEISPPIPKEYANYFSVNGKLLPGYTVEGEEAPQPDRAAEMQNGGDSISQEKPTEQRKEQQDMNEPLNIKLSTPDNAEGAWLKLPATAEQLNAALARIGAQGNDFTISGFETPIPVIERIPLENVQKAGIDELNYLAAQLEPLDEKRIARLEAVAGTIATGNDVYSLAVHAHNSSCYEHYPDVFNYAELGESIFQKSGLIQIPDEWADAVDREKLGRLANAQEKGVFTEKGYVVESGEEWDAVAFVPEKYQIAPKFETPEIDFEATAARAAPAAAVAAAPFVLVSDNPRDKLKEITEKLEAGIKGIFDSEQYKSYLKTLAKFHNYSFNNCMLIALQKPDASHVGGFNFWKDEMKRPVMKGEKGIKILAPAPFKTTKTVDAVDAKGKPVFGKDGKREKMEQEITVPAFKIVSVFDVSQTDGEPLPEIGVDELTGSVDKYKEFLASLEKSSPVPVGFETIKNGAKGFYHQEDKRIVLNEGMGELQTLKTLIHEIAHSRLHDIDKNAPKDTPRPDRRTREVEAESIAYTVCQHYGLDTSDYSFGYVADWSGDKQLDVLKTSLDTIRKEADAIITEVDKHFAEITHSVEKAAEQTTPAPEKTAPVQTEPIQEKPLNLTTVADYMQKLNDGLQAVKPDSSMSVGAYNATVKRLEQVNGRIPETQPQLKALIVSAAQSPDFNTLKERMNTLHTEFIQHYATAVQMTIDTSGKAEPKAPAATVGKPDPAPAPKAPAQGENVAAIEAKVNAGETINLTDLSDAIKKDRQAAQPTGKSAPTTAKTGAQTPAKKGDWKAAQSQDAWDRAQGKPAAKAGQPSIKDKIAAGKAEIAAQKPAQSRTQSKKAELGA